MKKPLKLTRAFCVAICAAIFVPTSAHAQPEPAPVAAASDSAPADLPSATVAAAPELEAGELSEKAIEAAPIEAAAELVSAVRAGDWRKTVALALSLLMLAFGRFRGNFKFLAGDRAGVVILFTMSAAGALVTSLLGNAPVDYRMFVAAFEIGLYAMGGFLGFKKLFWPSEDIPKDNIPQDILRDFPRARLVTR